MTRQPVEYVGNAGVIGVDDREHIRAQMTLRPARQPAREALPVIEAKPLPDGTWAPACMSADDWAGWRKFNHLTASQRVARPCADCPAAFAEEMRAEGHCNGTPGAYQRAFERDVVQPGIPTVEAGEPTSVGELIARWQRVRTTSPWMSPARAAYRVLEDARPPLSNLLRLAAHGLLAASARGTYVGRPSTYQVRGKPPRELLREVLNDVRLEAADGKVRALAVFTIHDWRKVHEGAERQVALWERRRAVATRAVALLETYGLTTTAELPDEVLDPLCAEIAEGWA